MSDFVMLAGSSAAVGGMTALAWPVAVDALRRSDHGTVAALRRETRAAGMDESGVPAEVLAWRGAAIAVLAAVWAGLGQPPLAVMLAGIVVASCPWWIRLRIAAHRRRVATQVAAACRALGGRVRVGLPLHQAIVEASADAPAPLGEYLRETARRIAQGSTTAAALTALKERVGVDEVAMTAVALLVADERGGRLAAVLDRIAFTAEEMDRLRRKRDADTASGRAMIAVMAVIPPAFLAIVYALDPAMVTTAFGTLIGQLVLAGVAAVVYGSVRWGHRIMSRVR